jgi:hypothetical protein
MFDWEFLSSQTYPINIFSHNGLKDGLKYYYKIKAIDSREQESKFSEIQSGIPVDTVAPAPPKGLLISELTYYSITLGWEPNSEPDVTGYNIYRANISNPSGWGDLIGTVSTGNESFIDLDVDELTTYYYVATAFDEVPNESNFSAMVLGTTKLGPHGPQINSTLDDIIIDEDTVDSTTINLLRMFKDINNDPLNFRCDGNNSIEVIIFPNNGSVILLPEKNWHGKEILTFWASDGVFNCSYNINITVRSINDPPGIPNIISPKNLAQIEFGELLNFIGECIDPDLPEDELIFNWTSDLQGYVGIGTEIHNIELLPGEHRIILTVTDKMNKSSSTTISITVFENSQEPQIREEESDYSLVFATILIIALFLILGIYIFNQKNQEKLKQSEITSPSASRFSFLSVRVPQSPSNNLAQQNNGQINKMNGNLSNQPSIPLKTEDMLQTSHSQSVLPLKPAQNEDKTNTGGNNGSFKN